MKVIYSKLAGQKVTSPQFVVSKENPPTLWATNYIEGHSMVLNNMELIFI